MPHQYRLPGFEGPLDVLLRLIERHELDVTAVSLAAVADQFLEYLARQPERDPALLAEFVTVASRLLLIKTRVLLPRPEEPRGPEGVTDEEQDGDELVRQLREYRAFKAAAAELSARDARGRRAFAPLASPAATVYEAAAERTLAPARPADLLRAAHRRLAQLPPAPRLLALVPRISVGEMAARIVDRLARLRGDDEVRFGQLVAPGTPRVEIVTTFMAILELVRRRRAEAHQETHFGEIVVRRVPVDPRRATVAAREGEGAGAEHAADD
jgi:segregation and condensation protein A